MTGDLEGAGSLSSFEGFFGCPEQLRLFVGVTRRSGSKPPPAAHPASAAVAAPEARIDDVAVNRAEAEVQAEPELIGVIRSKLRSPEEKLGDVGFPGAKGELVVNPTVTAFGRDR